jgi:hypothetical protein
MPLALHVLEQQTLDQRMARRIALLQMPLPPALQIKQIILHAKLLPPPLLMLSAMRVTLERLGLLMVPPTVLLVLPSLVPMPQQMPSLSPARLPLTLVSQREDVLRPHQRRLLVLLVP